MSTGIQAVQAIHAEYEKRGGRPIQADPTPTEMTNRYVWYPGEDIPHSEATAGFVALLRDRAKQLGLSLNVPAGFIERCRVAPILSAPVWERADSVPSEMRREGRGRGPTGDYDEYRYLIPAGHIFASVMEQYQGWGVVELKALAGMEPGEYLELKIDETFFPELKSRDVIDPETGTLLDHIPKQYSKIDAQILEVLDRLPADSRRNTLVKVGEDMRRAIQIARAFDTALVDEEETRSPLRYSLQGLRALDRLERQRRDHALNEMAKNQEGVIKALPEVLQSIVNGGAQAQNAITPEHLSIFAEKIAEKIAAQFAAAIPAAPPAVPLPEKKEPSSAKK